MSTNKWTKDWPHVGTKKEDGHGRGSVLGRSNVSYGSRSHGSYRAGAKSLKDSENEQGCNVCRYCSQNDVREKEDGQGDGVNGSSPPMVGSSGPEKWLKKISLEFCIRGKIWHILLWRR